MPPRPPRPPLAWLLAVAAPVEARAVLRALGADPEPADRQWTLHEISDRFHLLITGISKANAAGAVARFADPARHRAIVSAGIAGILPGSGVRIGQAIAATASVYADEGLATPDGFLDCAQMGFPLGGFPGSAVPADEGVLSVLRPLADAAGPVATVSTCSGTDALAEQTRRRTGALAEAMEGAAVGQVAHRLGIPFGELRVLSNTTGDRARQVWDLKGAVAALGAVIGRWAASGVQGP